MRVKKSKKKVAPKDTTRLGEGKELYLYLKAYNPSDKRLIELEEKYGSR
jgi:hypothetical protein